MKTVYGARMAKPDRSAGEDAQLEALAEAIVGPGTEPSLTGPQIDVIARTIGNIRLLLIEANRQTGESNHGQ